VLRRRAEQPLEASPQVRGFADVRLRLRIVAAEKKNGRRSWNRGPELSIVGRGELKGVGQHQVILVWICNSEEGRKYFLLWVGRPIPLAEARTAELLPIILSVYLDQSAHFE
jgi:hypothetical protein